MPAALLADVATIALVIGVIVSCTATLVMVLGVASTRADRAPSRELTPPAIAHPAATLAAARSRALRAAALESVGRPTDLVIDVDVAPSPEPIALPPAGRNGAGQDVPPGAAAVAVDDVRAIIDHLVETNPRLLAEVISQWIRDDTPPPDEPPTAHRHGPRR